MKKIFLFFFIILFVSSCAGTYKPQCDTPGLNDWSKPNLIKEFDDPDWGRGVLVVNTNLSGKFCYGYITYASVDSGPVKLIPVPRNNGKSIISGLAVDSQNEILFTGERTEREVYAVNYKDGKVLRITPLDRNPVAFDFLGDVNWKGRQKNKVLGVLGAYTPSINFAAIYLWEEKDFLEGKDPFYTAQLNMKTPSGMVYIGDKIIILPRDVGELEVINTVTGDKTLFGIPFSSLSWGGGYIDYCPYLDRVCVSSSAVGKILVFDYRKERWDGEIPVEGEIYSFQETGEGIYYTSTNPDALFFVGDSGETKLYDTGGYSFVRVVGNKIFLSLFNKDDLRILER